MENEKVLQLGTLFRLTQFKPDRLAFLHEVGMNACQLCGIDDNYLAGKQGAENTAQLAEALKKYEIEPVSLFFSFPGQNWSSDKALNTVGMTKQCVRAKRFASAARQMNWGMRNFGIRHLVCHVGFLPEEAAEFEHFIDDLREFCKLAKENGQYFLFETGPETDQEIKKCIDMLGMDNVGINLDPANLLLYDKTEPLDFADTLGKYVLGVHCKDGRRPVDGAARGRETPLGKGDAKFGEVMEKLYGAGFRGPLIIEREIPPGPEQDADIRSAMTYLHELRSRLMK